MLQNGGILEGGEPAAGELASDDDNLDHSPGTGNIGTTTRAQQDHDDSSSDSDRDSAENMHSTPPSMISELPRPTLPENNSASRCIPGSTPRSNNRATSEKAWFCVGLPHAPNLCSASHEPRFLTNTLQCECEDGPKSMVQDVCNMFQCGHRKCDRCQRQRVPPE